MADPLSGRTVWLVIPTYNEAANVEAIVEAAIAELPEGSHILVVDDASPDGTGEIADRLAAARQEVEVLHRTRKDGLGPAYVAGFRRVLAAGAGLVAQMDADFSHDPADLPRLIAATADADLVLGSRYVEGGGVSDWGPTRRAISRRGSAYARAILGVDIADLTGGFKVFRREVLEEIDLDSLESLGLRVPGGDDLSGGPRRLSCRRGADHVPRPPRGRVEDDRPNRGRGCAAGSADADSPAPLNPYAARLGTRRRARVTSWRRSVTSVCIVLSNIPSR